MSLFKLHYCTFFAKFSNYRYKLFTPAHLSQEMVVFSTEFDFISQFIRCHKIAYFYIPFFLPFLESTYLDSDIALLKVRKENGRGIMFDGNVHPVHLPERGTAYTPGTKCYVSGWGLMEGNLPDIAL